MIFFLKSCCSLNIYRSVGDGDNNNNQRKGVLAADVLLRLSESRDAERDAAPPASFQTPTDMGFQEEADGVQCATPPPATPGQGFAPSTAAARPCPSGSVRACPSLHSHFETIVCFRVFGCLICAWPRAGTQRALCRLRYSGCAWAGV